MQNNHGGNFPQGNNPTREWAERNLVLTESRFYFRFVSFYSRKHAETVINTLKSDPKAKIILDSGAYSASKESERRRKKGLINWRVEIDINSYIDFVEEWKPYLHAYVNLDIIGDGKRSLENYLYMKSRGLDPIPVFHAETGTEFLNFCIGMTDYIGIGAIADMNTKKRRDYLDWLWLCHLTDKDGMPKAKFHALGIGSPELLLRYPWYSADSTRWVSKYGDVHVPHYRHGVWVYDENPIVVRVSVKKPKDLRKEFLPKNHFFKKSVEDQAMIKQYFSDNGFSYGEYDGFENGNPRVISDGLFNRDDWRDQLNALYYLRLMHTIPPYPWPFKLKT